MRYLLSILFVFAASQGFPETTASQFGWGGDSGVPGPVYGWGHDYWTDSLVTIQEYGDVLLTTSFEALKHHIDGGQWSCSAIADLDGDGDGDVIACDLDSDIKWFENHGGQGLSWSQHTIATGGGYDWLSCGDIDGDGDMDFASSRFTIDSGYFHWWENLGGGASWQEHLLKQETGVQPCCVTVFDADGDGDMDVAASAAYGDDIILFVNQGTGDSWAEQQIDPDWNANCLAPADVDGDGDTDLAAAAWTDLLWYENDGAGTSWTRHQVASYQGWNLNSVSPADLDGDGDMDLVHAGTFRKIGWYENMDGSGGDWDGHTIQSSHSTGAMYAAAGDMDGDGTPDIIAGFDWADSVEWWRNHEGTASQWQHYVIEEMSLPYAFCIGDINGDDVPDPSGCGIGGLRWWQPVWEPLTGSITSSILNTQGEVDWGYFQWDARMETGSSVFFQVRSSADSTAMGQWSDTLMLPCSLSTVLDQGDRYFQYRALLSRVDDTTVPMLMSVELSYFRNAFGVSEDVYHLFGAFPNPAVSVTVLIFQIPLDGRVTVTVYDVTGREVDTLYDLETEAGVYEVCTYEMEQGVYFARIESGTWSDVTTFTIIE